METWRDLERDLEDMREYYRHGKTKEASWRKSQLKGLLTLLKEKEGDIFKALKQDLGKHHVEAFRDEIGTSTKTVNTTLESLKDWMSSKTAKLPRIALLTSAEIVPEPLGLVLIISSWNFPFGEFIEPTILVDPPLQAAIMTDEVFGPLLPIITLEKIEDSIQFINSRPKALAIYCFTKNKTLQRMMISETSSGSVTFNDTIIQYAADTLPFGGVGESGFGRYHGKFSFDTFSHEKAITRRSFLTDFWFRFPPWNNYKLQLLDSAFNYDYLGLVLVILGLKRHRQRSSGI
nr:aldehyde dehydrogenase family 3 member f1 [Quercus suber]